MCCLGPRSRCTRRCLDLVYDIRVLARAPYSGGPLSNKTGSTRFGVGFTLYALFSSFLGLLGRKRKSASAGAAHINSNSLGLGLGGACVPGDAYAVGDRGRCSPSLPRRHAGGATLWREVGDGLYHYLSASHPKNELQGARL